MPTGRKNLQVTLPSDNASASYQFDTFDFVPIWGHYEEITYLGKTARVAVNSCRYSGVDLGNGHSNILYSCSGVDYNSHLYNQRISYYIQWENWGGTWITPKLREHFQKIANALNLTLVWIVSDNFDVPCNEPLTIEDAGTDNERRREYHKGTMSELVDRLIGWSRDVPSIQYMVRISGNYLNVVQRGAENLTINIDNVGKIRTNPIYTMRQYFSSWNDGSGYIYSDDNSLTKTPFTGVIQYGQNSLTYENGYLMEETNLNSHITYSYIDADTSSTENAKYLSGKTVETYDPNSYDTETEGESSSKTTPTVENRSITTFMYFNTENERYLGEENEMVYVNDGEGNFTLDAIRTTVHSPLGNGWFGTTVYDDTNGREVVNTSLSQGAPGGKVSQYTVDSQQEALTNDNNFSRRRAAISGVARARATFPISDYSTLSRVASVMNGLNGSIEYTASIDLFGCDTLIDIDRTVVHGGKTWRVVQNVVEYTPTQSGIQHLQLIRWETT